MPGALQALLPRDTPEKGEVTAAGYERGGVKIQRQAVQHRAGEIRAGNGAPLRLGNRHKRHLGKSRVQRL